jgi:hypothetical protein
MPLIAVMGGGDWGDASVVHVVIPEGVDIEQEKKSYVNWYRTKYLPARSIQYLTFDEWLISRGARSATDSEVLEVWMD